MPPSPSQPDRTLHESRTTELRVVLLGSGSSGNATLVRSGDDVVLIDAGFSARETLRRLTEAGADPCSIRALLVTHEHTDHVSGVRVLARRLGIPVYATAGTRRAMRQAEEIDDLRAMTPGEPFGIGALEVLPFRTSHDAAEPVGFRITARSRVSFGLATDTGVIDDSMLEALAGCHILAIETNHDERMLAEGPYPYFLKQRIASDRGHLSNAAALVAVERLAHDGLRAVVGVHLSQENNSPHIAGPALGDALARLGLDAITATASQHVCTLLDHDL